MTTYLTTLSFRETRLSIWVTVVLILMMFNLGQTFAQETIFKRKKANGIIISSLNQIYISGSIFKRQFISNMVKSMQE